MRAVGIRELKNKLSEYLRLVKRGEPVLVTERGVVIAELRPPSDATTVAEKYPGLANLVRKGLLDAVKENDRTLYPQMPQLLADGETQRMIDEMREDKF